MKKLSVVCAAIALLSFLLAVPANAAPTNTASITGNVLSVNAAGSECYLVVSTGEDPFAIAIPSYPNSCSGLNEGDCIQADGRVAEVFLVIAPFRLQMVSTSWSLLSSSACE